MGKKLSKLQIESIRMKYSETPVTMKDLAKQYCVSITTIFNNVKNIDSENKLRGIGAKGKYCHMTILTENQVRKILVLVMRGEKQINLAKKFNVDQSTISNICTGKSWKHLFQKETENYKKEILKLNTNK